MELVVRAPHFVCEPAARTPTGNPHTRWILPCSVCLACCPGLLCQELAGRNMYKGEFVCGIVHVSVRPHRSRMRSRPASN